MGKKLNKVEHTFLFCDGGSCQKAGGEKVSRAARAYLRNNSYWETTHTIKTKCNGRCEDAPTCIALPENKWYKKLDENSVIKMLKSHLNEEEPLGNHLLYEIGMDQVQSENERPPFLLKPFTLKNEEGNPNHYETKGFSSDQYLYPLFLQLAELNIPAELKTSTGKKLCFDQGVQVIYSHKHLLELKTEEETISLVIGLINKMDPEEIQQQKIGSTIYYLTEENKGGIKFSNRKGEIVAHLEIEGALIWEYLSKIQLGNLELPNFDYS